MTDLVKRALEWQLSSSHDLTETFDLVRDMADEIEAFEMWKRGSRAYATKLENEIERLWEALAVYADPRWYTKEKQILADGGRIARKTLERTDD